MTDHQEIEKLIREILLANPSFAEPDEDDRTIVTKFFEAGKKSSRRRIEALEADRKRLVEALEDIDSGQGDGLHPDWDRSTRLALMRRAERALAESRKLDGQDEN